LESDIVLGPVGLARPGGRIGKLCSRQAPKVEGEARAVDHVGKIPEQTGGFSTASEVTAYSPVNPFCHVEPGNHQDICDRSSRSDRS
jgi:hypothetical protein